MFTPLEWRGDTAEQNGIKYTITPYVGKSRAQINYCFLAVSGDNGMISTVLYANMGAAKGAATRTAQRRARVAGSVPITKE